MFLSEEDSGVARIKKGENVANQCFLPVHNLRAFENKC
jgi:hypothetical protein